MTALEKLIDTSFSTWRQDQWYELHAYEIKAKATIKAMAEVCNRSTGQRLRYLAKRLKGA